MDYTNIDNRLDLDNQMREVIKCYPKNNDDYIFYIRGKNSTGEFMVATCAETQNFGYSLFNLASQNDTILEELLFAIKALKASGKIS